MEPERRIRWRLREPASLGPSLERSAVMSATAASEWEAVARALMGERCWLAMLLLVIDLSRLPRPGPSTVTSSGSPVAGVEMVRTQGLRMSNVPLANGSSRDASGTGPLGTGPLAHVCLAGSGPCPALCDVQGWSAANGLVGTVAFEVMSTCVVPSSEASRIRKSGLAAVTKWCARMSSCATTCLLERRLK